MYSQIHNPHHLTVVFLIPLPQFITPVGELAEPNVHLHLSCPISQVGAAVEPGAKGGNELQWLMGKNTTIFHNSTMSSAMPLGTEGYYVHLNCKKATNTTFATHSSGVRPLHVQ